MNIGMSRLFDSNQHGHSLTADSFDLPYDGIFRCITLGVHSSLEAVGLTAAVAGKLAAHGIAANVIAAYFHDHVFVQANLADRAIGLLLEDKN